jgi:hypothetical protein
MDTKSRPSPSQHASKTPIGTEMIGNDGNMWKVVAAQNGTHRWVRLFGNGSKPTRRSITSNVSKGDLINTKGGWEFYKKTLDDGRIVYTISKLRETESNRGQWEEIKSEMYLNTGFKWGRFGSFEKWGQIASEAAVIETAGNILAKYYQGKSEEPKKEPKPKPEHTSLQKIVDLLIDFHSKTYDAIGINSASALFSSLRFQELYKATMDDKIKSVKNFALTRLTTDEWNQIFKLIEDANVHVLNNYLALSGWYTAKTKDEYLNLFKNNPQWFLNPIYYRIFPESAPMTQFTVGDYFRKPDGIMVYLVDSYDNKEVFTSWRLKSGNKEGVTTFPIQDLIDGFAEGAYIFCDKDGKPTERKVKTRKPASETPSNTSGDQPATKEQLETAIRGLKILADKGNEKAIAALKGLNYLLSKK